MIDCPKLHIRIRKKTSSLWKRLEREMIAEICREVRIAARDGKLEAVEDWKRDLAYANQGNSR